MIEKKTRYPDLGQIERNLTTVQHAIDALGDGLIDNANVTGLQSGPPLASLLLVVSAQSTTLEDGRWQFAIETADGAPILEAEDQEPGDINRLTLLAAVRGLEAIDGPSGVTLLSHNRYLIRSLTDSLPRWRRSDFVWDHFGRRVEVQHADLWRRIDRTLNIHEVQACLLTARMVSRGSLAAPARQATDVDHFIQDRKSTGDNLPFESKTMRIDSSGETVPQPTMHRRSTRPPQSSTRLRDWVLQSAADSNDRAHRIAMLDKART